MATNNLFSFEAGSFIETTVAESAEKVVDKIGSLKSITKKMAEKQGGGKGTEFKNGSDLLDDMAAGIRAAIEKPAVNKVFRN